MRLLPQLEQLEKLLPQLIMFGHAIYASTYAVKSVAFATNFDALAVANERTWQFQHLIELGKTV
ncbi:hypothetical protein ACFWDG_13135 [Peribacillus sp. NPDC060186]